MKGNLGCLLRKIGRPRPQRRRPRIKPLMGPAAGCLPSGRTHKLLVASLLAHDDWLVYWRERRWMFAPRFMLHGGQTPAGSTGFRRGVRLQSSIGLKLSARRWKRKGQSEPVLLFVDERPMDELEQKRSVLWLMALVQ